MRKIYFFFTILTSGLFLSQTILNETESSSRTVQDPNAVVLAQGFHATSTVSNPFVAKVGASTETPPNNPTNSTAGSGNPSGEIQTGTNFHDTQGNIEVNGGGQLQFTLPIALPPGIKSVAPQINLVYTSGSGNGIAGYGWSLSGITAISRTGRTIEKDGETRGVQLDYTDYYSFNGQRLILKSGTYGGDGAEYVTEKFSNIKIKSIGAISGQQWQGPEYWEVTFEDGSQAWYGGGIPSSSTARTPVEYNIVKWKDAQGNYITYNYTQDAGTNVAVISNIQWGGNETLGKAYFNSIIFNYNFDSATTRLFREQSYLNGISFLQQKLLSNIIVNANGSQFKKYEIKYKQQGTSYQFIDTITEKNSTGTAANPVVFNYPQNIQTDPDVVTIPNSDPFDGVKLTGDFNGDSYLDFVMSNGNVKLGAFNDNFSTINSTKSFNSTALVVNTLIDTDGSVFNGNGIIELEKNILTGYLFKNNSFVKVFEKQVFENPCTNYTGYDKCSLITKLNEGDVDGDGISDAFINAKANVTIYFPCPANNYNTENTNIAAPPPGYCSETYIIDIGNFIVDLKNQNNPVSTYTNDTGVNSDVFQNQKYLDIDGDGKVDILNVSNTDYTALEFVKTSNNRYLRKLKFKSNLIETKNQEFPVLFGDFNGDGKLDFTIPITEGKIGKDDWRFYIGTGKGFNNFVKTDFMMYKSPYKTSSGNNVLVLKENNYSVADMNHDGKSDLVHIISENNLDIFTGIRRSVSYIIESRLPSNSTNLTIDFTSPPTKSYSFYTNDAKDFTQFAPLTNPIRSNNNYYDVFLYWKNTVFKIKAPTPLSELSRIQSISQGGLTTTVNYKEVIDDGSLFYKNNTKEIYPYISFNRMDQSFLVSQLVQGDRKQDFRYRGFTLHLQGRGMVGFRQTARSSWYTDALANTKIWSGAEIDPKNDGVPIKEWSIKTNTESQIFPTDISENNTQLLSFKSTEYRFDKRLNGALVDINTVSPTDKAKVVSATVPTKSISKDFMKDIRSESTVQYDNTYYLPTSTTTNINNGFAVSTTNLTYVHNPNGTGKDYYIGRPATKNEQMQVYGDSKNAKEDYTYENNLLKTKKTWNRTNSGWLMESYTYDGWGNITQKITTSSIDSNSIIDKAEYEAKGRFVVKKTDNLGLITNITYNDWGQVLTQTDPLGVILTNTYDGWGKLLTSKTNLAGFTTYQYKKESNGDAVVIEYSPDGNQKISYTNSLGQNYINKAKKFGQGQFVSVTTSFDPLGRKTGESEPYSGSSATQWNTIEYDDYSRPITVTAFTGKEVTTSYNGRTTTITETDTNNRFKKQTTDAVGNIISSEDLGGIITFKYNAAGENTEANYQGNIVKTAYDAWGNKTRFEDPSNGVYQYEYNGFMGAISKTKSPKGEKTYEYNNKGQLIRQKEKSTDTTTDKTINISYNGKGMITGKSGTSLGKTYSSGITYDNYGRVLSSFEDSNGKYFLKKDITYDGMMRVVSYEKQLYSSGILTKVRIENAYDTWNGELYQVKEKGTGKILWQLNSVNDKGQVTAAKLGNVNINNTYDTTNGFLSNVNHTNTAGSTVLQMGYTFDAIKNELTGRRRGGDLNIIEQFQYDSNNRLYNWTDPVTGAFTQNQQRNVYDNKGRITENDQVGSIAFNSTTKMYQATGMTLNTAGNANYTNDLLQKISYNENNDPVFIDGVKGDVAFEYGLSSMRQVAYYGGNFEQPTTGSQPPNSKFTKYYSEDGSYEIIRNNQTGQEKHLIYIGGTPYESNIVYLKNYTESSGSFKFLHKDYLGSILAITDEAGNKLEQRHFDAWGNVTHLKIGGNAIITDKEQIRNYLSNGNLIVDRGYTSHEHFAEVGLIHMNGRLYDPLLRRFLNADENIQDPYNTQNYNKYGYVLNNPLMFNDPSGEFFWIAMVVGAIIGGVQNGLSSMKNGGSFWGGFWKGAIVGAGSAYFAMGMPIGVIPGFFFGATTGAFFGALSAALNGQNVSSAGLMGGLIGGITGGIMGGYKAYKAGINVWTGTGKSVNAFEIETLQSDLSSDPYAYSSDSEMADFYNKNIGSVDGISLDQVEKTLNTNVTLGTSTNLPEGYSIDRNSDLIVKQDGTKAGGITETNWRAGRVIREGKSYIKISPGLKRFNLYAQNMVFKHEFMHAWHWMNYPSSGTLNSFNSGIWNTYSERATSTFSLAYEKAYGLDFMISTTRNALKEAGGMLYPNFMSWRKFNNIIPLWIK